MPVIITSQAFRKEIGDSGTIQAKLLNAAEYKKIPMDDKFQKEYIMTCDQLCAAWMLDLVIGKKIMPESGLLQEPNQYPTLTITNS